MDKQATMLSTGLGGFWEQLVNWYQNSLLNDVLSYIADRYYRVELGAYEYFSFGSGANETARMLILAIAFGFIIAAAAVAYTRTRLGGFVRTLLKNDCLSPETAKTLFELGYFRNSTIRWELTRGVTLRKLVLQAEQTEDSTENISAEEISAEENPENASESYVEAPAATLTEEDDTAEKAQERFPFMQKHPAIDFTTARFYIPEDLKYRAEIRFEKKGSGWIPVLLTAIGSLIGAAVICYLLPDFIGLLDQLIMLTAPQ